MTDILILALSFIIAIATVTGIDLLNMKIRKKKAIKKRLERTRKGIHKEIKTGVRKSNKFLSKHTYAVNIITASFVYSIAFLSLFLLNDILSSLDQFILDKQKIVDTIWNNFLFFLLFISAGIYSSKLPQNRFLGLRAAFSVVAFMSFSFVFITLKNMDAIMMESVSELRETADAIIIMIAISFVWGYFSIQSARGTFAGIATLAIAVIFITGTYPERFIDRSISSVLPSPSATIMQLLMYWGIGYLLIAGFKNNNKSKSSKNTPTRNSASSNKKARSPNRQKMQKKSSAGS